MNSRAARRLATQRLARAARQLGDDLSQGITGTDGLSDADRVRVRRAFEALAHELDVRTGAVPRQAALRPVDPAQETLFEVNREGKDRGQEAGARPEAG